jgi:hypothetical protein
VSKCQEQLNGYNYHLDYNREKTIVFRGGVVDTFVAEDFDRDAHSCVFLEVVNNKNFLFLQSSFFSHSMV